jgi:type VI secretion system secreted protein VgrG
MDNYTQDRALIAVNTPLGKDVLLLLGFSGREEMSRPFRYTLEMLSSKDSLAAKDVIGKSVTWMVRRADRGPRYFNGIVSRFMAGGFQIRGLRYYRAEVVPGLWFLTRTTDCRIFQNKTAPQIIEQIFKDLGFTAYKLNLRGSYATREYCVQYRETDLDFVSRLMEQEGIFYFFSHDNGKHTMTLADQKTAYADCPENSVEASVGKHVTGQVTSWEHQYEFRSGKWSQQDYNFETPSTDLTTKSTSIVPLPDNKKYELYDYPGDYPDKGVGGDLTKVRMEEEEAPYEVAQGASTCSTFTVGGKFKLKTHESSAEVGQGYAITAIEHFAKEASYAPEEIEGQDYGNKFTCIPDSVTFRPARLTPRAVVRGPQTAVVVGPKGEEIYTDKYGRVKVQFFWDREGKKDENSSCWMRVAQNWAGKNWGIVFHPRIGQEVIVDFLEGDPDRPIITGRVYNADQMPPYALPANQTQSTVKSRSSKGGAAANFNELRFEDKKGSEEVYFHAEKDFNRVVENNDTLKVGFEKKDKGDQTAEIFNNQKLTVGAGKGQAADGSMTLTVYKDRTATLETGNDTLTIQKGNQTTKITAGSGSTEAMQFIELKVGANSIRIDPTGITLKGINIMILGQAQTLVKAPNTTVLGDAVLILTGGQLVLG